MAIGFPGSPFNKKQFSVDSKLYEYNSTLGAWSKGVRAPVSPGTASITDISNLVDGSSLLNNVGSTIPSYATEVEILSLSVGVQDGQMAYAEDTDKLYVFSGYSWYKTSTAIEYVPPLPATWYGSRGVFAGGYANSQYQSEIRYLDISTTGTTTNFGNLTSAKGSYGDNGVSNGTRGIFGGGRGPTTAIDYITIASPGAAANFGALTQGSRFSIGSASNGDHGLFGGGYSGGNYNTIDHIVPDTLGDSTNFGTLAAAARDPMTGEDATYALFADDINGIDYFTFDTTGTASNFGTLTAARSNGGGTSDDTRTVFAGGWVSSYTTTIDYVTTATPGNAANFGALTIARGYMTGITDGTWGMWAGGAYPSGGRNHMDYVTIQTLSAASTWGTWPSQIYGMAGTSGAAA